MAQGKVISIQSESDFISPYELMWKWFTDRIETKTSWSKLELRTMMKTVEVESWRHFYESLQLLRYMAGEKK